MPIPLFEIKGGQAGRGTTWGPPLPVGLALSVFSPAGTSLRWIASKTSRRWTGTSFGASTAQPDLVASDFDHNDRNVIVDDDTFVLFSG